MVDAVDAAFAFLGDTTTPQMPRRFIPRASVSFSRTLSYPDYAQKHFSDPTQYLYMCREISAPLLKHSWTDTDTTNAIGAWIAILKFLGDIEGGETHKQLLQLAQHIVTIGLANIKLRDEIYCQICRQLSDNPSRPSAARGWVLMALCASAFSSSAALGSVLQSFISNGPPLYCDYILERLRASATGIRKRPPIAMELAAVLRRETIKLDVELYVRSAKISVKPQLSVSDAIDEVLASGALQRDDGFVLGVRMGSQGKFLSFGDGPTALLDLLFDIENVSNADFRELMDTPPWTLQLRRQYFAPWSHNTANDAILFAQIVESVGRGELPCEPTKLPALIARLFYAEHGVSIDQLSTFLSQFPSALRVISFTELEALVRLQYMELVVHPTNHTKSAIVAEAPLIWAREFSRIFSGCTVVDGDNIQHRGVSVVLGRHALTVEGESNEPVLRLPFTQITDVGSIVRDKEVARFDITFVSHGKVKVSISTNVTDAERLQRHTDTIFKELLSRSQWAVATCTYRSPGTTSMFLSVDRGDVIVFNVPWKDADNGGWCTATCERTQKTGELSSVNLIVVPCLERPDATVFQLFQKYCTSLEDE